MSVRSCGTSRIWGLLAAIALAAITLGPARPTSAQGTAQSVVYLDMTKPVGTIVWLVAADGSSKTPVGDMLGPGVRPLDLQGSLLAVAEDNDLVTVNLASGAASRVSVGARIQGAYIANDTTVFYSTHPGCGPVERKTMIGKLNPATGESAKVADIDQRPGIEILSYNADTDELTAAPRGCDPGIGDLWVMSAKTGQRTATIKVEGCGWAAASLSGAQALISYGGCIGAPGDAPELRAYDLPGGDVKELHFDKDAPSLRPWVYAPEGTKAAFGLALNRFNATAAPKSGGIWLLDTASLETSKLWQDGGQESWAVDWSADGSNLLVASREEENACSFSILDVATGQPTRIAGLTACGTKGTLVGFATVD